MLTKPEIIANLQADKLWLPPEGATEDEKLWFREAKVELAEAERTGSQPAEAAAPESTPETPASPDTPATPDAPAPETPAAPAPDAPASETTPPADAPAA